MKRSVGGLLKRRVAAQQRWHCLVCAAMLDEYYEVDHIVPLHKGGEDHIRNCQALHRSCHAQKTHLEETERLGAFSGARLDPAEGAERFGAARVVRR